MSQVKPIAVVIVNPLKHTLAHYEDELLEVLGYSDKFDVEIAVTVAADGITGKTRRLAVAMRTLWQRFHIPYQSGDHIIVVTWLLFGYLEPLTLLRLARHNVVYAIVHDPCDMRPYARPKWARALFMSVVRRLEIRVIYHTEHAQSVGTRDNGVHGEVVPHPVGSATRQVNDQKRHAASQPVVRVLGQYKPTRSVAALTHIADEAAGAFQLEIYGRGWPDVQGWKVTNEFVSEEKFCGLVRSSDCVVVAYDSFFQSGVAARCLEAHVPVVAPENEHIAQLYGEDWVGTVRNGSDWCGAIIRALAIGAAELETRRTIAENEARDAWQTLLLSASRNKQIT